MLNRRFRIGDQIRKEREGEYKFTKVNRMTDGKYINPIFEKNVKML